MSTTLENVQALVSEYEAKKSSLIEEIKTALPALFQEVFAKYPALQSFSWNQYTPGYCDGDPCHFNANVDTESITVNEIDGYSLPTLDDEEGKELYAAAGDISSLLSEVPYEVLDAVYGDPVEVTVSRDGTIKESYYAAD